MKLNQIEPEIFLETKKKKVEEKEETK